MKEKTPVAHNLLSGFFSSMRYFRHPSTQLHASILSFYFRATKELQGGTHRPACGRQSPVKKPHQAYNNDTDDTASQGDFPCPPSGPDNSWICLQHQPGTSRGSAHLLDNASHSNCSKTFLLLLQFIPHLIGPPTTKLPGQPSVFPLPHPPLWQHKVDD